MPEQMSSPETHEVVLVGVEVYAQQLRHLAAMRPKDSETLNRMAQFIDSQTTEVMELRAHLEHLSKLFADLNEHALGCSLNDEDGWFIGDDWILPLVDKFDSIPTISLANAYPIHRDECPPHPKRGEV